MHLRVRPANRFSAPWLPAISLYLKSSRPLRLHARRNRRGCSRVPGSAIANCGSCNEGLIELAIWNGTAKPRLTRSEEHTSELQSQFHLVCRLLLEKKNKINETYSLISST